MTIGAIALSLVALTLLGMLVAAVVVGLGFYFGWFRTRSGSVGAKGRVAFGADTDKFWQDEDDADGEPQTVGLQVEDGAAAPVDRKLKIK